jgi:dTDP-4-dehydrorhamnose reductase
MLATDFIHSNSERFEILAYDRASLDITDIEAVDRILSSTLPDIVVNAAAFTAVDLAETTGKRENYTINTL